MQSLSPEFQTAYYYGVCGGDASVQLIKVEDGGIGGILFFPFLFVSSAFFFMFSEMAVQ